MTELEGKVTRTIRRNEMIHPGERVLVALSGGPDSVALTWLLAGLRGHPSVGPFEIVLAHFHHGLRESADADQRFCEETARRLELTLVSARGDVRALALETGASLEEAARLARHGFLQRAASERGCSRIALGHTRDDQAETVLLRLLRGAGARGLGAMAPVRGAFIRPLLETRKAELISFLRERGLAYREDPTNRDRLLHRNRVRLDLLPLLERDFNPAATETLARTADVLREDEDFLAGEARSALETMAVRDGAGLRLDGNALDGLHPALARRVIRLAIEAVKGDLRGIGARHVQDVLDLGQPGRSGRRILLPGLVVARSFHELSFRRASRNFAASGYNGYDYPLPVPGRCAIPETGAVIEAHDSAAVSLPGAAGASVVIPWEEGGGELRVVSPRRGDRFRPLGAPGSKSLSRYLMERRVAIELRRSIPLVVRGDREILWVAGHGVSESCRLSLEGGRRMLRLSWHRS